MKSKQLWHNKSAMKAAPEYAQAMSKMSNLAEINAAMNLVPVREMAVKGRQGSALASRLSG